MAAAAIWLCFIAVLAASQSIWLLAAVIAGTSAALIEAAVKASR
jgi:hypothetical protein